MTFGIKNPMQRLPRRLETALYFSFLGFAVLGMMPFFSGTNGQMSLLFDLIMLLVFCSVAPSSLSRTVAPVAFVAFGIITLNFAIFTFFYSFDAGPLSTGEIKNFIYSNKLFYYVFLIPFFVNKKIFSPKFFELSTFALLGAAAIKYTYVRGLGLTDRPKLLLENNYEAMTLMLLCAVAIINRKRRNGQAPLFHLMLLTYVLILSGSRSAVLAFIPLFLLLYYRKSYGGVVLSMAGAMAVVAVAAMIFMSRGSDLESIDRFRFFSQFLSETKDFGLATWLFGSTPLTPLSTQACSKFSYYFTLFSSADDGRCYALIFHSLFMRAIFDHGFLGTFFAFWAIWKSLRVSGFSRVETAALISMPIASALSVSSIGTAFVSLPIALASAAQLEPRRVVGRASRSATGHSKRLHRGIMQRPKPAQTPLAQ